MKRTPIKRGGPIKPKRHKPGTFEGNTGRIRKFGEDMTQLREAVYERSRGLCELKLKGCEVYAGWLSGQLCHVISKGRGGSDSEGNTLWGCLKCHAHSHNAGGKPCPKKVLD